MECLACKELNGEQIEGLNSQLLCEDCYIDQLCDSKPVCNPWSEYLSTRSGFEVDKNVIQEKKIKSIEELLQMIYSLGATDAGIISTNEIEIRDELALLCENPRCENFGTSFNCPPHISGPDGFRKLIRKYSEAIVFRLLVPSEIMYSHQRIEIFRLLHEIGATIEEEAKKLGYINSKAYAGGSCKKLFCSDHLSCNILSGKGKCRNPEVARQSMSGFGINVSKLMVSAGLEIDPSNKSVKESCGMILIGS
ncbi:MAG: DUF2284 domain-containing protein [Desulfobacterales bacterium]|nr:DUF2284 domain-containing protein [Desulfobacterales bacterium]